MTLWWVFSFVQHAHDQGVAGTVVQGLAAAAVAVGSVAVWLVRWGLTGRSRSIDLDREADELAKRVEDLWRPVKQQWGLKEPVAVAWTYSTAGVGGPVEDAMGDGRTVRFEPLPGAEPVTEAALRLGDTEDLYAIYAGLDSGRLILTGQAGAGKSGAMVRLLLNALGHRDDIRNNRIRARVPVPVLLTAYDWDPEAVGFSEWVAQRLGTHRASRLAASSQVSAARALVDDNRISVLLDGVDDMQPQARASALRAISETDCRVVLSIRSEELLQAVGGRPVRGAAVLELQPIKHEEAAAYLTRRTVHPMPAPWQVLVDHVQAGNKALAEALDTPLMLSLLIDNYLADDPVDELLDPQRFPTRQAVEDHLLARVLPAAYARRPGRPAPRYSEQQARRWLGHLAEQMNQTNSRDLAWWRICKWEPELPRTIATVLGTGITSALGIGLVIGPDPAVIVGLLIGFVAWVKLRDAEPHEYLRRIDRPARRRGRAWKLLAGGVAAGLVLGLSIGVVTGLVLGLGAGLLFALVFWLMFGLLGGPELDDQRPGDGMNTPLKSWRGNRRLTLTAGLVSGIAGAMAGAFVARICGALKFKYTTSAASTLIPKQAATTVSRPASKPPHNIWGEIWQGIVKVAHIAAAPAVGVWHGINDVWHFGLEFLHGHIALGPGIGLAGGLAGGLAFGLAFGLTSPPAMVWKTSLAFVQMRAVGHGPVRMMRFLDDARERGVLRTVGPVYQFRHDRLQKILSPTGPIRPRRSRPRVQRWDRFGQPPKPPW